MSKEKEETLALIIGATAGIFLMAKNAEENPDWLLLEKLVSKYLDMYKELLFKKRTIKGNRTSAAAKGSKE